MKNFLGQLRDPAALITGDIKFLRGWAGGRIA
jgi:hypothetical protein